MNPVEIYSVSEFIQRINIELDNLPGQVIGEVSELKMASSGHAYFTLKDKDTGFVLPCTIWARDYMLSSVELELGMEVAVTGKANYYGPFGKLSFNAKTVELVGEGALKKAYDKLKKKLIEEGLFAAEKKRPLPLFPQKIGVITSLHGAVIHDFSNNLGKFGFVLSVLNSKVEGPESGRELALSVRAMRSEDIDILVIIRGGGSIQSLAGFDNEMLVREIATFPVPVLAGVGHHQDVTLAALAADVAESTPSLVATLINTSWVQATQSLDQSERLIITTFENNIGTTRRIIDRTFTTIKDTLEEILSTYTKAKNAVSTAITSLEYEFKRIFEKISSNGTQILNNYQQKLVQTKTIIDASARFMQAHSPEHQLKFGYSIIYKNGKIIRSTKDVKSEDILELQVSDGIITTTVTK
ncbi:MAG: exodeoxyribonuclease VII large subunit [Candidatus Paceibacterota bacterium]